MKLGVQHVNYSETIVCEKYCDKTEFDANKVLKKEIRR